MKKATMILAWILWAEQFYVYGNPQSGWSVAQGFPTYEECARKASYDYVYDNLRGHPTFEFMGYKDGILAVRDKRTGQTVGYRFVCLPEMVDPRK